MDTTRYCPARLTDRHDVTGDLAIFRFRPEETLSFTPGQFATLGLQRENGDERPLLRPYSVASAPHERELEFFVELVDDGDLTSRLWHMQPGDRAWVRRRIAGLFVLNDERRRHLMAATVTGITPYVSIARAQKRALELGDLETPHRLVIVHGGSTSGELGRYRNELTALDRNTDWLTYVPTVSRPWEDPGWNGERGRVEDVLRKHMDDAGLTSQNAVAYACGHPKMVEKAHALLARAGFEDDYLEEEKYFRE
jgi:ferredoxin--NADP+ reductase